MDGAKTLAYAGRPFRSAFLIFVTSFFVLGGMVGVTELGSVSSSAGPSSAETNSAANFTWQIHWLMLGFGLVLARWNWRSIFLDPAVIGKTRRCRRMANIAGFLLFLLGGSGLLAAVLVSFSAFFSEEEIIAHFQVLKIYFILASSIAFCLGTILLFCNGLGHED